MSASSGVGRAAPVSSRVRNSAAALRRRFQAARPFPHLILDGFLEREFALSLAGEFPAYDAERFVNELGQAGKAIYADCGNFGRSFRRFERLVRGRPFVKLLESLTGIAGLRADPGLVGAGAQENLKGMSLPAHVDFSIHPETGWHRRVNFLLYLTPGWRPGWGGELELRASGRGRPRVRAAPLFNRCVIFATSDRSWHSVRRVAAPASAPGGSRKSVSLYFYTRERPSAWTPRRGTVWIYPSLPRRLKAGAVLDEGLWNRIDKALVLRELALAQVLRRRLIGRVSPLAGRLKPKAVLTREDVDWIKGLLEERKRALDIEARRDIGRILDVAAERVRARGRRSRPARAPRRAA